MSSKIMPHMNIYAKEMVSSIVQNNPNKNEKMTQFFKYANDSKLQGNALVSYYTELNKLSDSKYDKVVNTITLASKKGNVLHEQARKFVSALNKNYPKTLQDRVSLASQSSVVDGEVKPKSFFKKLFTVINRLVREE